MATINDLRKHVLDDAVELMETLGIVTPLATSAAIVAPAQLLLRRLLTGHVVLVLTRLHEKAGKGQTGITASIDGILEAVAVAKASQLNPTEIDGFKARRDTLQKDMQPDGVSFADLHFFRTSELAHSVHAPVADRTGLSWAVINIFARGTYELVRDIEGALIEGGAVHIRALPADKYDEWTAHGRALWHA